MSCKSLPCSLGLVVGGMFALVHVFWSLLVALGWAQTLVDTSLRLHMIQMSYRVLPFDLGSAIGLIIVTGVIGCILGWAAGTLWNKCAKCENPAQTK